MSVYGWVIAGAAGALATLVLLELGARWYVKKQGFYSRYKPYFRLRLEIDQKALPTLDRVARVEINGDGERGGEPPRRGEPAYRVLVAGGSAAECFLLDQDRAWPAVVQRLLSEPENLQKLGVPRVHVGSIARPIITCAEMNLILRRVLPRYPQLDLIMLMIGVSDLISWLEKKMPATIGEKVTPVSSLFDLHPETPWGLRPSKTAIYRLLSDTQRRIRKPVAPIKDAGSWLHRVRKMRAEAKVLLEETPDPTPMLDAFEANLREAITISRRAARRVILVRQPFYDLEKDLTPEEKAMFWNYGLGRAYKEEVDTYCSLHLAAKLLHKIDERAAKVGDDLGVQQVNLRTVLESSPLHFYDSAHFTIQGAEVVARTVAEAVLHPEVATTQRSEVLRAPAA